MSNLIKMSNLKGSSNTFIKKFQDSEYFGEIIENKREGIGIMSYDNGRIFEGYWQHDFRNGQGYEKFANGNVYIGNYINGKSHGSGAFMWENGDKYKGEWKNGLKDGVGSWNNHNNLESYVGDWKNNKPHGKGIRIFLNKDKYEGDFFEGLKHGFGTEYYINGDIYQGQFQYGVPYGEGQYFSINGSRYTGTFVEGKRHGYGKWQKTNDLNSNNYQGMFNHDNKHGFGVYKWQSGNEYRGQFSNDMREGIGQMTWVDGNRYIGEWKAGVQNGFGRMIYVNGKIVEGYFENNNLVENKENIQIPPLLKDPNFNINKLAPKDYFLSNGNPKPIQLVPRIINKHSPVNERKSFPETFLTPTFSLTKTIEATNNRNFNTSKKLARIKKYINKPNQRSYINIDNYEKIETKFPHPEAFQRYYLIRRKNCKSRSKSFFKKMNRQGIWVPNGSVKHNFENSRLIY